MGKVASSLGYMATRPFREFNLEHRVAKELARDKRPAAPRHTTTAAVNEQLHGDAQSMTKKDDLLLDRLKSVYVTSQDITPKETVMKGPPERPLPSDRRVVHDPDYGYFEPQSVPYGKVTLREAVQVITRHQDDPRLWPARRLAREHKLTPELTEKVLKHFRMFVMFVPPHVDKQKQLANPELRQYPRALKMAEEKTAVALESVHGKAGGGGKS